MFVSFLYFSKISGRVAALNMLKKPTKLESVPFFWTVLFGKSIRYTGRVFLRKKKHIRIVLIDLKCIVCLLCYC